MAVASLKLTCDLVISYYREDYDEDIRTKFIDLGILNYKDKKYDEEVRNHLVAIWHLSYNEILKHLKESNCTKNTYKLNYYWKQINLLETTLSCIKAAELRDNETALLNKCLGFKYYSKQNRDLKTQDLLSSWSSMPEDEKTEFINLGIDEEKNNWENLDDVCCLQDTKMFADLYKFTDLLKGFKNLIDHLYYEIIILKGE